MIPRYRAYDGGSLCRMYNAQEIAAVLKGEPEPLCELLNKDFTVKIIGDIHTNPELIEVEQ